MKKVKVLIISYLFFLTSCYIEGEIPQIPSGPYTCDVDSAASIAYVQNELGKKCITRWLPEHVPVHVRVYDGYEWSDRLNKLADISVNYINFSLGLKILTTDSVEAGYGVITIRELPEMLESMFVGNTAWITVCNEDFNICEFFDVKIGLIPLANDVNYDHMLVVHELAHAIGIGHPSAECDVNNLNDPNCECQAMNGCSTILRDVDLNALISLYSHPDYSHIQLH